MFEYNLHFLDKKGREYDNCFMHEEVIPQIGAEIVIVRGQETKRGLVTRVVHRYARLEEDNSNPELSSYQVYARLLSK